MLVITVVMVLIVGGGNYKLAWSFDAVISFLFVLEIKYELSTNYRKSSTKQKINHFKSQQ